MDRVPQHHLVVVPHTHWDREWYRSFEEFRYRLLRLLDGLLDLLDRDPDYRHFTLDGQVIVLDDYLEVRPGECERIAKKVGEGRLLIGPWYVLPDEWLVSGEALIRNLRLGLAKAEEFGGCMRLGYVPDQFGHVGQLPQIFAGFGFEAAVLWRGVGDDVNETVFTWEAPDGTRLFTVYLMRGYGNAMHLPVEPEALAQRLAGEIRALEKHSRIPTLLLMNGSDHLEPQPGLPAALAEAVAQLRDLEGLGGLSFEIGTLPGFALRARGEAPADLSVHRGELRSGLRAPLLEGCASARAQQKRADFLNDRLLTRYLEPLSAWLAALGGDADTPVIDLAWRIALENHPHDSICGCSVDAVHEQMETRFARVAEIAGAHLRRVTRELGSRVAAAERGFGPGARERVIAWNPNAGGRVQVEGEVELDVPSSSRRPLSLHLRDAAGRRIPAQAEIAEPGEVAGQYTLNPEGAAVVVAGFPPEFMGQWVRDLRWYRRGGQLVVDLLLGEDPCADFDLAAAKRAFTAALEREADCEVLFRARRLPRVRLRFVDELPGCGLRVYRTGKGPARAGRVARAPLSGGLVARKTEQGGALIQNQSWRVEALPDGRVRCEHLGSGILVEDAVRLVSEGDRGDSYSFDPVPGALPVERPSKVRVRLAPASEAEVGIVLDARYRVPAELGADRRRRSRRTVLLPARIGLRLAEGLDRVDLSVAVDNTARDHRLRVLVRAPFSARRLEVESAFETVERPIAPDPSDFGSERPAEFPIGASPQRGFATLFDDSHAQTVANRGCSEVEALREQDGSTSLALTLLRAVGWLSRDDLGLRPGHAGPPLETPGAQVPGPHRVELSWRLHAPGDPLRTAEAHRFAAPALAFAGGKCAAVPSGELLGDGARLLEIDDPAVLVSAIEPPAGPTGCTGRPGHAPVARLYNASPQPRRVRVRWNGTGERRLRAVDLAGCPAGDVHLEPAADGAVTLALRGWQLVGLSPL
jgi:alpha-mannosidase